MILEMFQGRVTPAAAGGFVGLLSLFNMAGRFFWSSLSDYIGRKVTYGIYFLLGSALYAFVPQTGKIGNVFLFVMGYGIIMSMYGGGFATIPAYLRDLRHVAGRRNTRQIADRVVGGGRRGTFAGQLLPSTKARVVHKSRADRLCRHRGKFNFH